MNDITRKLASIRRISEIKPIEGADNIICAVVDGWELVTQKSNNFQPNDLVAYFEIDSFLPMTERFEFLRKSSYKKMGDEEGFRLKTIKLRGQISQGLILPLSEFMEEITNIKNADGQSLSEFIDEGLDLTEILGVKKWEPPIPAELAGKMRGNFPSWIVKTDQERIQNVFKYHHRHAGQDYEATIKLDGSSMTVYVKDGYVGVCSRNIDLLEEESNTFWNVARKINIVGALELYAETYHKNIAIQGELMGPGIQGNREDLKDHRFFVFDVFDINSGDYLSPSERKSVLDDLRYFGATLHHVPVIGNVNMNMFTSVQDFLDYADKQSSFNNPIAILLLMVLILMICFLNPYYNNNKLLIS